jgi:hypothetical protein
MSAIRRRLPATWRIVAAVAIVGVGVWDASEIPRRHGVPLFIAAVGCGAVLGSWALGGVFVAALGFWLWRGIETGFWSATNPSGDNIGAQFTFSMLVYIAFAAVGVLLGMGLRGVVRLTRLPRLREQLPSGPKTVGESVPMEDGAGERWSAFAQRAWAVRIVLLALVAIVMSGVGGWLVTTVLLVVVLGLLIAVWPRIRHRP